MPSDKPLEGRLIPPRLPTHLDAFGALSSIVSETIAYLDLRETERTKRADIESEKEVRLAKIQATQTVLQDYFDRIFTERRRNTDELFARYDDAIERGDMTAAVAALDGVVEIAKSSPLSELGDLSQVISSLNDPSHVHEL